MTDQPSRTKPRVEAHDTSGTRGRSRPADTEPESELTRRAREVLVGRGVAQKDIILRGLREQVFHMGSTYRESVDTLVRLGILLDRGHRWFRLTDDLGRECARLLALEVGRG